MNSIVFNSLCVGNTKDGQDGVCPIPRVWRDEEGNITVARFKGSDQQGYGDKKQYVMFDFVAYGDNAKWLANEKIKLHVGSRLYVVGHIQIEKFKKEDTSVARQVVVIDQVTFAGPSNPKYQVNSQNNASFSSNEEKKNKETGWMNGTERNQSTTTLPPDKKSTVPTADETIDLDKEDPFTGNIPLSSEYRAEQENAKVQNDDLQEFHVDINFV